MQLNHGQFSPRSVCYASGSYCSLQRRWGSLQASAQLTPTRVTSLEAAPSEGFILLLEYTYAGELWGVSSEEARSQTDSSGVIIGKSWKVENISTPQKTARKTWSVKTTEEHKPRHQDDWRSAGVSSSESLLSALKQILLTRPDASDVCVGHLGQPGTATPLGQTSYRTAVKVKIC